MNARKPRGMQAAYLIAGVLALGAVLALLDREGAWLRGWLAYSLLLGLGAALFAWAQNLVQADAWVTQAAVAAFGLRLAIGVTLAGLLPQFGYVDNQVHENGYFFYDAFLRDREAWQLASSNDPLYAAFGETYSGDQYGGTLAVTATIYRTLSPDAHRPNLILTISAAAAALGVLFLWKAVQTWFEPPIPILSAWLLALYPEGVLLGASQMREAILIPAVAMSFYGLTALYGSSLRRSPWILVAALVLLAISPPVALANFGFLFVIWLLDPEQRSTWKRALLYAAGLLAGLTIVIAVLSQLPSLERAGPLKVLLEWFQYNFGFQSYLLERSSGWVQKLIDEAGDRWQILIVTAYGFARPVLPAQLVVPGAALMRVVGVARGLGWYLLAPLLIYGVTAVWRARSLHRRRQLVWMTVGIFVWIIVAALVAGGDQWDNPRYRAIFLPWQAVLAAWAWIWARARRDAWLTRWLAIEGLFVLLFTEWYISRYYPVIGRLNFWVMVAVILGGSAAILLVGWIRDRQKTKSI